MTTPNAEYRLRLQTEAAKALISDMRGQHGADIFDGDEEFLADTIEGETGLIPAIEAALKSRDEDLMLAEGVAKRIEELQTRLKRLKDAAERKKSIVERAMVAAEIKSLPLPVATLTISKRAPGLIVVEEADIPSEFWKPVEPPAPKLDKAALAKALRDRKAAVEAALAEVDRLQDPEERKAAVEAAYAAHPKIPGADLDNGGVSLSIRSK